MKNFCLTLFLLFFCGLITLRAADDVRHDEVQQDFSQITEGSVGMIMGSTLDLWFTENRPNMQIKRFPGPMDVIMAVEHDVIDYCALDTTVLIGLNLKERGMRLVALDNQFNPVCCAFRLNDTSLQRQFNEFIARCKQDGTLDSLKARWIDITDLSQCKNIDLDMPTTGKPIRVGVLENNPVFSMILNNQRAGYEVEIAMLFARYLGRPIEMQGYEFSALVPALNANMIDMIFSTFFVTEERAKQVLFSDPYYFCQCVCVVHDKEKAAKLDMWKHIKDSINSNLIVEERWKLLLHGLYITLAISICSILLGSVLGALICWMRMGKQKYLVEFAKLYVNFMRGIPMLVFLMMMFYVILVGLSLPGLAVAIISFAMNFAAYVSEMFRTGIEGVDRGQTEAGRALGFSKTQTFNYFILPQALQKILPVFKGEAISLIKNTSVVGYIAIQDLTKISDIIRSRTFEAFVPLIIITIIYFFLAWLLGLALKGLSNRLVKH